MTTLEIPLPADLDRFIREQVESGAYADASAVVRDALRRLAADAEFPYEAKLAQLREALRPGLDDIAAGRLSDRTIDEIMRDAETRRG
jgi:antitoxin ParD1/3/4